MRHTIAYLLLSCVTVGANAQDVSVSLVTDSTMIVAISPDRTIFDGDRITAKVDHKGGSSILIQADHYEVVDDFLGKGKPAVVLTGSVVMSDGAITLQGDQVWFDPENKNLIISGIAPGVESNVGVISFECRGRILYRNNQRAAPGEDRICPPDRTHCYVFYCDRDGKLQSRIVFQDP
jgi:hypothetical protein